MSKPSDYYPWLEQFPTADYAAWSAWKEVQTLTARVAVLENILARVRCCEGACCPQCAEEIAELNIPLP